MLISLCGWLAETAWSIALHESTYMYPLIESVHVWTLCFFIGFTALLDVRLLGVALQRIPASTLAARLLPWMKASFVVMVVTGTALFYAIPVRTYQNLFFRAKVVLLVLAGVNAVVFHYTVYQRVSRWERDVVPPVGARLAATASIVLWAGIIVSGRMIAYNWFDCDKKQTPLVRTLAGCGAEGR
jgi:hypothetical protein